MSTHNFQICGSAPAMSLGDLEVIKYHILHVISLLIINSKAVCVLLIFADSLSSSGLGDLEVIRVPCSFMFCQFEQLWFFMFLQGAHEKYWCRPKPHKPFACPHTPCPVRFSNTRSIQLHVQAFHSANPIKQKNHRPEQIEVTCEICNRTYQCRPALAKHMKIKHTMNSEIL